MLVKSTKLTAFCIFCMIAMEDVVNGWYQIDWPMIALAIPVCFVLSMLVFWAESNHPEAVGPDGDILEEPMEVGSESETVEAPVYYEDKNDRGWAR